MNLCKLGSEIGKYQCAIERICIAPEGGTAIKVKLKMFYSWKLNAIDAVSDFLISNSILN